MENQNNHPHYNPQLLEEVAKNFPEYSREQHAQMVSNIEPHLLSNPHQYHNNLKKEASGVKVYGEDELQMRKKLAGYFENKRSVELTEEQKEKNKAYIEKVKTTPTYQPSKPLKPKKEELMDLGKAKIAVWEMYCKELGFDPKKVKVFKAPPKEEIEGGYVIIDAATKGMLDKLTRYFIYHPSSTLNLNKGLYIFGGCGVGKTALFRTFSKFTFKYQLPNRFTILKTATLIKEVLDDGKKDSISKATYSIQMIDDLGEEAGLCEWYKGSNKGVNTLKKVLDSRYEKFKASGLITHTSSNLKPGKNELGDDELAGLYGERLTSRFKEMFNVLFWEGEDKRR